MKANNKFDIKDNKKKQSQVQNQTYVFQISNMFNKTKWSNKRIKRTQIKKITIMLMKKKGAKLKMRDLRQSSNSIPQQN